MLLGVELALLHVRSILFVPWRALGQLRHQRLAKEPIKTYPMIGPSTQTLITNGGKQTSLIVNQEDWYRLVSPMILHTSLVH